MDVLETWAGEGEGAPPSHRGRPKSRKLRRERGREGGREGEILSLSCHMACNTATRPHHEYGLIPACLTKCVDVATVLYVYSSVKV